MTQFEDDSDFPEILQSTCTQPSGKLRVDKYLVELFPELNRSRIQKALEAGQVRINGIPVSKKQVLEAGDVVEIQVESEKSLIPHPVEIALDVLFEDDDIIVVNKPANMVTHPGNGTGENTLAHALLFRCRGKLSTLNGEDRPGIVHRLDKDTTGLLVAAKSDRALKQLIEDFKERDLDKRYLAVCMGCPKTKSGTLNGNIGRHPVQRLKMAVVENGKNARTDWVLKANNRGISLMECKIHTGRTHQIRVHLSHMGYPIVGDVLYGFRKNSLPGGTPLVERPLLHAWKLEFNHPVTRGLLRFEAELPMDFVAWKQWMQSK